jgi:hypothetical protein
MSTHEYLNRLLTQIKNPTKRNWILMVPNSLGETLYVCGLAKSFVEKHGHGVTLVISETHKFIAECYANTFDQVVYLDKGTMRLFSESGYIPKNCFQIDFPYNTYPQQNGEGRIFSLVELWTDTLGKAGLDVLNMYRYILRLDWGAKFQSPVLPKEARARAAEIIEKHGIKKDKSVVLLVGNNTCKPSPALLWEKLANNYHAKGYDVIVNTYKAMFTPANLNIPFAKRVDLALDVLVPICEHAGNVVSGANGGVLFALSFAMDFHISILMPTEMCFDWQAPAFRKINNMSGCHQLSVSEIADRHNNLYEWNVPADEDCSEKLLEEIADDIFGNNKGSQFLLTKGKDFS